MLALPSVCKMIYGIDFIKFINVAASRRQPRRKEVCACVCVADRQSKRERGRESTLVQLTLSPSWNGIGNEDGHRMGLGMGTRLGKGRIFAHLIN